MKLHGRAPAELKRMWVSPAARGLGIGRHLLGQLEQHARDAGARVIRLETNRALREAIELYRKSGYVEVAPFNQEPTHITGWRSDLPQKKVAIPGERPLLVIIAESTARKYWPTRDPLGRRVRFLGRKCEAIIPCTSTKVWACPEDLKRRIRCSRSRVG